MVVLDTSVLVRFLTQDIKSKAEKVKLLLETERRLFLPEVVLPELEYVLGGQYGQSKEILVKSFNFLVNAKNIKTAKYVKKAIKIYKDNNIDMADCLIAAKSIGGKLASFDRSLLKVKEVKKYWD
ncbi:MAG: PIN domain-containing protein [Candidatus Beckwithbacteria bacterium]|nr:PIN domain-containing protein [Patescibacteria group bacterium]